MEGYFSFYLLQSAALSSPAPQGKACCVSAWQHTAKMHLGTAVFQSESHKSYGRKEGRKAGLEFITQCIAFCGRQWDKTKLKV